MKKLGFLEGYGKKHILAYFYAQKSIFFPRKSGNTGTVHEKKRKDAVRPSKKCILQFFVQVRLIQPYFCISKDRGLRHRFYSCRPFCSDKNVEEEKIYANKYMLENCLSTN